jgi:hypothetical protein
VEKNHELLKLPAKIFSQIPKEGQKIAVTLFRLGSQRTIAAFLRGYEEDPLGESGIKAILEIPKNQLHHIKNYHKLWQVFPPMVKHAQHTRSIHEINF